MRMTIMRTVRERLGLRQTEMAAVAGVSQATISRWETGSLEPNRQELERIRGEALRRGVEWDDALFFTPAPLVVEAAQ
jgi:transcriptional regulator with XRE-family HTH domain